MFRRRQPLTFFRSLRGFLWPRTGWRRAFVYYLKRLTRLSGTPHNIAAGFACGVAISFTPLVGLHVVLGCVLALIVRGNFLAMVVGTLVGNPWTLPFMWLGGYELGKLLLGGDVAGAHPLPWRLQDLAGYFGEAARQAMTGGSVAMLYRLAADLSTIAKPVLVGRHPARDRSRPADLFPPGACDRRLSGGTAPAARAAPRRAGARRGGAGGRLKAAGAPTDAGTV